MDAFLAITSKRDVRDYAPWPIPPDVAVRILDAGRLAGSARNRQPWRFLVVESADLREGLAQAVYAPGNVRDAALVVAIVAGGKGPIDFDCGRAAQNMMLAAWAEGVASCPNGLADADAASRLLALDEVERPQIVLSFGYPARPSDPEGRAPEEWSRRADRRPLDEIVTTL